MTGVAIVTTFTGLTQETREYPCRNHPEFDRLTYRIMQEEGGATFRVSHGAYDDITSARLPKRGVHWLATLHAAPWPDGES